MGAPVALRVDRPVRRDRVTPQRQRGATFAAPAALLLTAVVADGGCSCEDQHECGVDSSALGDLANGSVIGLVVVTGAVAIALIPVLLLLWSLAAWRRRADRDGDVRGSDDA